MSSRPDGADRGPFWSVFECSHIPMALVDHERRYVAVNEAACKLYGYSREDIIGRRAGSGMPNEDPASGDSSWAELERTGELYGERLVRGAAGPPLRVSFAAHATKFEGRWLALYVVLSAHAEPGGEELVAPIDPAAEEDRSAEPTGGGPGGATPAAMRLTPREREIVQQVALGRSTPQIAADLGLSPATVRSHVRNAMVKTGAHTRAQLVALVLGEGLTTG